MNNYIFYKPNIDENGDYDFEIVHAMHNTLQNRMPDKVVVTYVHGELQVIKDDEFVEVETIDDLKDLLNNNS